MKRFLSIKEEVPVMIEREELHRMVRNILTDENLANCQRSYLELIEDLYFGTITSHMMFEQMKELGIPKEILAQYEGSILTAEKNLEKWERHLLQNSFCSAEPCF